MAIPGFIFGKGTTARTPEQLKRMRDIADALAARSTAPKNVGEGLQAVGNAILYRQMMKRADAAEETGRAGASSKFADAIYGQAPGAASDMAATSPAPADVSTNGDTFSPFIEGVRSGGLTNPYALAAVAATGRAESGWSAANADRTWADPSESGQPGTAGGIMSWRGPRLQALQAFARDRGEGGNGSPATQAAFFAQEDPRLIERLQGSQSLEDAQGLMNGAWQFAGYNRPGGEAARRMSYASGYLPQFQGQQAGTEVASLDPSAGMPAGAAAIETQASGSGYVDPVVSAPNAMPPAGAGQPQSGQPFDGARFGDAIPSAMDARQAVAGAMAERGMGGPSHPYSPAVASVGNAMLSPAGQQSSPVPVPTARPSSSPAGAVPTQQVAGSGYFPPAPPQPGQQSQGDAVSLQRLYRALEDPWISEGQQRIILSEIQRRQDAADPLRQLQIQKARQDLDAGHYVNAGKGALFNTKTGEWVNAPVNPNAPPSDLGLNPQYGVDQQGNPVILQLGKDGKVVQSQMPSGVTLSKEPIKLDAGTQWVLLDPITRQPVGSVPKENREAAFETAAGTAAGKAQGEAQSALPGTESFASNIAADIDDLKNDKYLPNMLGWNDYLPNLTPDAARVQGKIDKLKGGSFLAAREWLKGQGQITDFESGRAERAYARLSTAQNVDDFKDALDEFQGAVKSGVEKARKLAGQGNGAPVPIGAPPQSGPVSIGGFTIKEKAN